MKSHPIKQNMSSNQKQIIKEKKDEVVSLEEVNKVIGGFNLEHELNKVKIIVPLTKLIKNKAYKETAFKNFKNAVNTIPSDEINLQDKKPTIAVGSKFDKPDDNSEYPPPFYVTFSVHDQLLHNCLLDSGASHNLMPKSVMEAL